MIVPMKKATIIVKQKDQSLALKQLRRLGAVHLANIPNSIPSAQDLQEKKLVLEKALSLIPIQFIQQNIDKNEIVEQESYLIAQDIIKNNELLKSLDEEFSSIKNKMLALNDWNDVSIKDLDFLVDHQYKIAFFETTPQQIKDATVKNKIFIIKKNKTTLWIAVVYRPDIESFDFDFKQILPPQYSRKELEEQLLKNRENVDQIKDQLSFLNSHHSELTLALQKTEREIEFLEASAAMTQAGPVSVLSGFIPEDLVPSLKNSGKEYHWGLLIQSPSLDDDVPTIVKNKSWVSIISPVFDLLGTIPGYRENDISIIFLLFFTFFFAAIIGDAGYGFVLFSGSLTIALNMKSKNKKVPSGLFLMLLLSFATIVWGAITGNWFGSVTISSLPFLSWLTIPALSSFDPTSGETYKYIFFIVGTVQISIAHIWNFYRQLKDKPFIRAFAQLGWLFLVLGLYYLVLNLVLSKTQYPLPIHAAWLMIIGLLFIFIFSCQEGKFFIGIGKGLANFLTTFLSSISAFSDIISYIRLFAVGLAGIEIAKSFNAMASGFGSDFFGVVISAIILLLGHTLNIAMGALSVVVHGVRLNMLEFSGHLGMEWTGKPYKPFKE